MEKNINVCSEIIAYWTFCSVFYHTNPLGQCFHTASHDQEKEGRKEGRKNKVG